MKDRKIRKRKGVAISVTVEDHVISKIDEKCGGKNNGRDHALGKMGGRNHWVRALIYKELGIDLPEDPRGSKPVLPLSQTELNTYISPEKTKEFTVEMYDRGYSYQQIAELLELKKIPTSRGGKWHKETVRQMIYSIKNKNTTLSKS